MVIRRVIACTLVVSSLCAVAADDTERAVEKLRAARPDLPIESVASSPVAGLFTITLSGGSTLYATANGDYLIAGDLYSVTPTELVNLSERSRDDARKALLAAVDPADMVIFAPKGETKAVVNVFTDVDCGFCQKLHREMADYNALGIEIRYLAYPRSGLGSPSYDKAVTAWCSDDRRDAITRLKKGEELPAKTCPNPVADQYQLGREIGITGTPALVTESGRLLPGYVPAKDLAQRLGI